MDENEVKVNEQQDENGKGPSLNEGNLQNIASGEKCIEKGQNEQVNKEPYIYSDYEISSDDDGQNPLQNAEKLAIKNKKYIAVLKKASSLFHLNQSKQYLIKQKKTQLEGLKSKLDGMRNQKKTQIDNKRSLAIKKEELLKTVDHQKMRIRDLTYTLQLLEQLNSQPITQIPEQIFIFQNFITEQYTRIQQNNNLQKVHAILEQQDPILDNLISIREQLNKE